MDNGIILLIPFLVPIGVVIIFYYYTNSIKKNDLETLQTE